MIEDIVKELGFLTLGTRFKRIGEALQAQTQALLTEHGIGMPAAHFPLLAALDWQLHYYRANAWINPLSSASAGLGYTHALPDGVRLVLDLPGGQALAGRITSDWVRPTVSPAEPQS